MATNKYTILVGTALLIAFALAAATLSSATPTTPLQVKAENLPLRYLIRKEDGHLEIRLSPPSAAETAVAKFRSGEGAFRAATGWGYLEITSRNSSSNFEVSKQSYITPRGSVANPRFVAPGSSNFYYSGFVEGLLEATQGRSGRINPNPTFGSCQSQWLQAHFAYLFSQYEKYSSNSKNNNNNQDELTIFWQQQIRIWNQLEGIADGINQFNNAENPQNAAKKVNATDVFLFNFDIGSVNKMCSLREKIDKYGASAMKQIEEQNYRDLLTGRKPFTPQHCSGLVRATKADLFVAQATWSGFSGYFGERIFKVYNMGPSDASAIVSFSSGPLMVASGDDWYQIKGHSGSRAYQLSVFETTDDCFNSSLFVHVVPASVSEFMRIMGANYAADTPQQWASWYDGSLGVRPAYSYINSYVIASFDMFIPGQPLKDGTVWVSEITPGYGRSSDISWFIRENGYYPSFNIYYDEFLYSISGYEKIYKEQGSFWSWRKYARPEIFRAYAPKVEFVSDMQRMMRWNKYKDSNYSLIPNCTGATAGGPNTCSPAHSSMLAIASRGDLMTVYPTQAENIAHYGPLYGLVAQGCFGATDAKIATYTNRMSMAAYIINGPTNDDVPTFGWSGACGGNVPVGAPAKMDFPWVLVTPAL